MRTHTIDYKLLEAAEKGDLETIIQIERDFPTHTLTLIDEDDRGMLHYAAKRGQVEVLRYILDKDGEIGLEVDETSSGFTSTPLYVAAEWGRLDAFIFLEERGANLEYTYKGLTPIDELKEHKEVYQEYLRIKEQKIKSDANISISSDEMNIQDKEPDHSDMNTSMNNSEDEKVEHDIESIHTNRWQNAVTDTRSKLQHQNVGYIENTKSPGMSLA